MFAGLTGLAGCHRNRYPTYPEGFREFAYVANAGGNSVTVLDLVYLRPEGTLSVGRRPVALAVNPVRDEIYVVNSQPGEAAGSVSVIDAERNAVVATIAVRREPDSIALDEGGRRAYVTNAGSGSVSVIDLLTDKVIGTFGVGERPTAAAIAPDGRSLLVTSREGATIFEIAARGATGPAIKVRAVFRGCAGATSPVVLPDSSRAFLGCSDGHQVMSLSLAAAPVAAALDGALTEDHVLALLDVGRRPSHLTLKPDGGEIFVSNLESDSVSEISTGTNDVGSTYAIGKGPGHGVVSNDNSALWVSETGSDSISLYSIADGKLVSSLRAGMSPDALAFSHDENLLLAADTQSGDVSVIRTTSRLGPALLTILPAGGRPSAIVTKALTGANETAKPPE